MPVRMFEVGLPRSKPKLSTRGKACMAMSAPRGWCAEPERAAHSINCEQCMRMATSFLPTGIDPRSVDEPIDQTTLSE